MDDSITLLLYLVIAAIVGIVTLIKKVMEKAASGEGGRKINLAQVVQEQMERYMKGGPPGRFGRGRAVPGDEQETTTPPPVRPVSPTRPVPPARTAPPPILQKPTPPQPRAAPERHPGRIAEQLIPFEVKADIDAKRSLVAQAAKQPATATSPRRGRRPVALTRKNLRKAVLLAEILGPPVSERKDYRLF